MNVHKLPAQAKIETGPVVFGGDWPGMFIRGDDCLEVAAAIRLMDRVLRRVRLRPDEMRMLQPLIQLRNAMEQDVLVDHS